MAVAFTGTNSGRVYVSGQLYANGNGVYRANADGSFSNLSTGRNTVGSSQSDKAVFFNTGGSLASSSGPSAPRVVTGSAVGSGPGVRGVANSPAAPAVVGGPGAGGPRIVPALTPRGAFLGTLAGSGTIKTTDVWYRGMLLPQDKTSSDVEAWEQRYGEPGEWVGGIAVMGTDGAKGLYEASTLKGDKVSKDLTAAGWAIAEGFVDQRQRLRVEAAAANYAAHQRQRQENTGYPSSPPYSVANPDPYFGPTVWQPLTLGADGKNYRTGGGF